MLLMVIIFKSDVSQLVLSFTFMGGAIIYKSKTQFITAGSSTKAKFIADNTAAKLSRNL